MTGYVLCWDIDGTLLTTSRAGVFALEEALREVCGLEADLGALETAGLTDAEVAALVIEHAGGDATPESVEALLRSYERHLPERLHWRRGTVLPGVVEVLEHLRGRDDVTSLLLTGNTPAGAEAKLRHYGLADYFADGAFCVDARPREEIAARARRLAAERLGADPDEERFFVIGDTPFDVRCGKAARARTVAVASGRYPLEELRRSEPWLALEGLPEPAEFERLLGLE